MSRIIISLNGTYVDALAMASKLSGRVWGFRVGTLITRYGVSIIASLGEYGNVFADLRLMGDPHEVEDCVGFVNTSGAKIVSVHAAAGAEALKAARATCKDTVVAGVVSSTALSLEENREVYRGNPCERFEGVLRRSGVTTVVCPGDEVDYWGYLQFIKIVPGVRPFGQVLNDDQARPTRGCHADYLVIGRPITQSKDPISELQRIKEVLND